ncbi:hypothetical protein EDB92DRAFT_1812282 [Lactarius akahatsu]|uniref:Uncharacterized protein n=1 Tax=Lactarius akahatsu TaxID=416441 RepID=A0AAD4LSA1_9AGAM|nr:hypothetical protein EDB92DRAFT_1812282 [Lactarius akahatsu]
MAVCSCLVGAHGWNRTVPTSGSHQITIKFPKPLGTTKTWVSNKPPHFSSRSPYREGPGCFNSQLRAHTVAPSPSHLLYLDCELGPSPTREGAGRVSVHRRAGERATSAPSIPEAPFYETLASRSFVASVFERSDTGERPAADAAKGCSGQKARKIAASRRIFIDTLAPQAETRRLREREARKGLADNSKRAKNEGRDVVGGRVGG